MGFASRRGQELQKRARVLIADECAAAFGERLNSLKAGGASLRFAFMPRSIGARCGPDRSFDSKIRTGV